MASLPPLAPLPPELRTLRSTLEQRGLGDPLLPPSDWGVLPGTAGGAEDQRGPLRWAAEAVRAGCREMWAFARKDHRKPVFAAKVATALALITLLVFLREPIDIVGHSVWAILTVVVVFEFSIGYRKVSECAKNALVHEIMDEKTYALIKLGAKTIYVPGIFPLGCLPRYLYFFRGGEPSEYDSTGCLKWLNGLTGFHNHMLKAKIGELRRAHPGVSITYVDYYDEVLSIITTPAQNGFNAGKVLYACCGGGGPYNANLTVHCSDPGMVQCPDPSKYVSWDGLHMTEAVYKIMARGMLDGPFAMPPIMSSCNHK